MLRNLFSLFPAYAGVILSRLKLWDMLKPFPRIRGGDPRPMFAARTLVNFSPHTRG